MTRSAEYRRERETVSKLRARKYIEMTGGFLGDTVIDNKQVGLMASTHCKPCSCCFCGNPRKHFLSLTVAERKANESEKESLREIV